MKLFPMKEEIYYKKEKEIVFTGLFSFIFLPVNINDFSFSFLISSFDPG